MKQSIIDPEFYRDQTEVLSLAKSGSRNANGVSLSFTLHAKERLGGVSAIHNKGGGHSFVVVTRVPTAAIICAAAEQHT
jgi:hypothetical protein